MGIRPIIITAAVAVASGSAQWLTYPTPGIPRTPDGKPNLSAPAPRTPDGKPDLSGIWGTDGQKYYFNIAADLKPGDVQTWADAISKQRADGLGRDDPSSIGCLPQGPRVNHYVHQQKIIQTPNLIVMLVEDLTYRQIFLDGRELPKDPNPSFMGYSVGHWDGDTLVVESSGFKDTLWLDLYGHPHTEALRITERFKRTDFGHMEIQETIDDPKAFNKPFTITLSAYLLPDSELLEYVCTEGEKDRGHLVGKASDARPTTVKVAPEVLAKYVGTYDFRNLQNPSAPRLLRVTLSNGRLLLNGGPLMPLSETTFSIGGQPVAFVTNDKGIVTGLTIEATEGILPAVRIPDAK